MQYYKFRYWSPEHGGNMMRYSTKGPEGEVSVTIPVPKGREAVAMREKALKDLAALAGVEE